jgi:hypothetical protein
VVGWCLLVKKRLRFILTSWALGTNPIYADADGVSRTLEKTSGGGRVTIYLSA